MSDKITGLTPILRDAVEAVGYEFLGCEYIAHGSLATLRIYIDSPSGINVEDCALASRQMSAALDVEDSLSERYTLEVSSPGIERPLFTLPHYQRFIGSKVKIRTRTLVQGKKRFVGILQKVDEDRVVLEVDGETFLLPFSDIQRGNLVVEFK